MNRIELFAPGTPKGQPRPRAFFRQGRAAVYDPGTAEGWKGQIALAWRDSGHQPLPEAPYDVMLDFVFPRPKSHSTKRGLRESAPTFHTGKPDADNAAKAVLDALTTLGVWKDDALVACITIRKTYGNPPGCYITITALNP